MPEAMRSEIARISVLSGRAVVRLKSWLPYTAGRERTGEIDGRTLPSVVGTATSAEPRFLCLGPNEWLAVSDVIVGPKLGKHIEHQTAAQDIAVVDVSQGLAALRVEGPAVLDVLTQGCGLDLHPRVFPEGLCARTRFAQVTLTLDHRGPDQFDLYVGRSYLAYLQAWLMDAAGPAP